MFALGIEDVPSKGILVVEDVGEEFAHDWLGLRRKREWMRLESTPHGSFIDKSR
jgi:hypothetical protein